MGELGHVLRIYVDRDTLCAEIECHEPAGAVCRVVCEAGCESFSYPDHEHPLEQLSHCTAVDWIGGWATTAESYLGADKRYVSDGVPVRVEWDSDHWQWEPLESVANGAGWAQWRDGQQL